ncbi:polysaccharide pyruvyl transferase family protein [Ruegeria arenilitoris]|uniref:polysaccharide pyruvyl transferase family protein n=1 Tax=Ruegeria arenilitoris TaxID=1173585 RepID=UPI00147C6353
MRRGFDRLFALSDIRCSGSLPLGLWSDSFKELSPKPNERIVRKEGRFRTGTTEPIKVDIEKWRKIRNQLAQDDTWVLRKLSEVDALVVNSEGSMHHNLPRALALAALIDISHEVGTPVALMNSSIQAMDDQLISEILGRLSMCHVRERRTFEAVEAKTSNAVLAPDLAVLAMTAMTPAEREMKAIDGRKCIVAAGVLVDPNAVRQTIQAVRACDLEPTYLSIGDGREAEIISELSTEEDFNIIDSGQITLERLVSELSGAAMLVSGRHHINIFAMLCGLPFVPLPSNTWKIEATIEMAGYPISTTEKIKDLEESIRTVHKDRLLYADASKNGFIALERMMRKLPEKVRKWTF